MLLGFDNRFLHRSAPRDAEHLVDILMNGDTIRRRLNIGGFRRRWPPPGLFGFAIFSSCPLRRSCANSVWVAQAIPAGVLWRELNPSAGFYRVRPIPAQLLLADSV